MEFRFEDKMTALDMWKLSMHHIYHSLVGWCNAIFSVAIILLTIKLWDPEKGFLMGCLLLASVAYPIVQPVMVYLRGAKQVAALMSPVYMYPVTDRNPMFHGSVFEELSKSREC